MRTLCTILLASLCLVRLGSAEAPAEVELRLVLSLLPETDRAGAKLVTVRDGRHEVLREGSNHQVCELDAPGDDRFSVSCYHAALEPYFQRERRLRLEGLSRDASRAALGEELANGTLSIPAGSYQAHVSGTRTSAGAVPDYLEVTHLVYLPMAESLDVGLPDQRAEIGPWLHNAGTVDSHVMWSEERPLGFEARSDSHLEPYLSGRNFNGAVLVTRGDEVLLRKGYGAADLEGNVPNTPETRFRIASLSKGFTAAAILQLVERGSISLDDALPSFVDGFQNADQITVHHLLTHTSGIPDINRYPEYGELSQAPRGTKELVEVISTRPPRGAAGARYSYSNSNYNLLAHILEEATGRPYGAYLEEQLLSPLGLEDTGHDDGVATVAGVATGYIPLGEAELALAPTFNWSVKTGNGSLYSTVDDLALWARGVSEILSGKAVAEMFSAHVNDRIGYGWFVGEKFGKSVVYMNGNSPGFSAYLARYPEEDVVVIVLANNDIPLATSIGGDLAAMLFGETVESPKPIETVSVRQDAISPAQGRYRFPYGLVAELTARDGDLYYSSVWPSYESQLLALSENEYFHRYYWDTLVLERQPNGDVTSVHWKGSPDAVAERID